MNIIKSFSNIFSFSIEEPSKIITDIEDIHSNNHKEYKENHIFNELMERIASEFENNIENFKTNNDIDKFKKNIQKKYKYTISNAEFIKIYKYLNLENQQLRNLITKKKCKSNSGVLVITVLTSAHPQYINEDGEIKTACAQGCPTNAIVFGDFNDPNSQISELFKDERSYHLLASVGARPSVFYQTKVWNRTEEPVKNHHS